MAIPDGSHYTDSSRRYVRLSSGETVSRATAENMHARGQGYQSNYERRSAFRRSRSSPQYPTERERALQRDIGPRDFDEARARLYADYHRNNNDWRNIDKSPNGPLAQYLEAMGRRQTGLDYNVGETPSVR